MSYDIQIWSIAIPQWQDIIPNYGEWKILDKYILFEKPNWQIVIGPPSKVLEEDIPEEIIDKLPGIQYLLIFEKLISIRKAIFTGNFGGLSGNCLFKIQ